MNKSITNRLIEAENNNRQWAQFYEELLIAKKADKVYTKKMSALPTW